MPLTVGTAGHIDHGKTWLVRALTGKDTDRLPEEQRRGISIDLGYAPLDLPDGRRLSLIDVPGHERFVRNMVAGATGIDLFLLVIDAGEGARPQTHEHLAIIRLLGLEHGVVAVTKADAVDDETLELALAGGAGARPRGDGGRGERQDRRRPRRAARRARARGGACVSETQSRRARPASTSTGSSRCAGSGRSRPGRSGRGRSARATCSAPSRPGGTSACGASRCTTARSSGPSRASGSRSRSRVSSGASCAAATRSSHPAACGRATGSTSRSRSSSRSPTARGFTSTTAPRPIPARVVKAGGYAQLRLAAPVVAARGDRVVLRDVTTVGGGTVLDPAPARHADPARFEQAERGETRIHAPVLVDGDWRWSDEWLAELQAELERSIDEADPLDPGAPAPTEPWAKDVLARLPFERRGSLLYRPGTTGALGPRAAEAEELAAALEAAAPGAVKADDAELARFLERAGRLVRLGDGWAVSAAVYERARTLVLEECSASGQITLARFRDLAGCGRRDAQLLLERLDADGVTRRVGEARVLRRRASAPAP